jgi:serine phosphatase RsbU (regulator of sigma subunit)
VDRLESGLESLRNEPTDLMLLDLMLPDSEGLETFRRAKAQAGTVPIILLSALQDKSLALSAVSEGAEDFLVKGQIEPQGLGRTLHLAIERHRRERAERELGIAQEQLRVARRIQRQLLPIVDADTGRLDLAGATALSEESTGDYYDYFPTGRGGWVVVVGDVSGQGLGSTILMVETRAFLRALAESEADPGELLTRANRLLFQDTEGYHFVSLFCARIDPGRPALVYAGAGQGGYLIGASGNVQTLKGHQLVLGVNGDSIFQSSPQVDLQPGDVLLAATNGITEATSIDGESFGRQRLIEVVQTHRQHSAAAILGSLQKAVNAFTSGQPQADGLTAVVARLGGEQIA